MNQNISQILSQYHLNDSKSYYSEAFSRNIGLLSSLEQETLQKARIAIPGLGGVGGIHLITLVRTGVGNFNIADFDVFEPANINRQFGSTMSSFGASKLSTMKEQALNINPFVNITEFPQGINPDNLDSFLKDVDVVVDGLDFFKFDIRRLLFNKAREKGIYVITAAPLGFSSALLVFAPDKGMGFDQYFDIVKDMSPEDQYLAFAMGLAPRPTHARYMDLKKVSFETKAGPSLNIACQISSGLAGTKAIQIILQKGVVKPVPYFVQFDPYLMKFKEGSLWGGNKNPLQRIKKRIVKRILQRNKERSKLPIPPPEIRIENDHIIPVPVKEYILKIALLAPSADNCQPWKFEWEKKNLALFIDQEKADFFYDVNQESTWFTFGALIENISLASSRFGLDINLTLFPNDAKKHQIASIGFDKSNRSVDPLIHDVHNRCVNRNKYKNKAVPAQIIDDLKKTGSDESTRLMIIDQAADRNRLEQVVLESDIVLFENKTLHQELFQWINLSQDKDIGMNMNVLGVDYFQAKAFSVLSDWKKMQFLNRFGISRMVGQNSVKLLKSSSFYCLFTIDQTSPDAYVKGGRVVERFWIRANQLGLCVQPMAGFIFLINHWHHNKAAAFDKKHQTLIEKMKLNLDHILEDSTKGAQRALMFFRVGYADLPKGRTGRMKVKQVAKFI